MAQTRRCHRLLLSEVLQSTESGVGKQQLHPQTLVWLECLSPDRSGTANMNQSSARYFLVVRESPDIVGLSFCEVGFIGDATTAEGEARLEGLLREAFSIVFGKGSLKGTPQII